MFGKCRISRRAAVQFFVDISVRYPRVHTTAKSEYVVRERTTTNIVNRRRNRSVKFGAGNHRIADRVRCCRQTQLRQHFSIRDIHHRGTATSRKGIRYQHGIVESHTALNAGQHSIIRGSVRAYRNRRSCPDAGMPLIRVIGSTTYRNAIDSNHLRATIREVKIAIRGCNVCRRHDRQIHHIIHNNT